MHGGMKSNFFYKDDRPELIDIANFIRSMFPQVKVKIELFAFFNEDGTFDRFSKKVMNGNTQRYRHPDLTLFVNKKFLCCVEIDGRVHDVKIDDTDKRNKEYADAGVDLLVVNKAEVKLNNTNIFEFIEAELSKRLN